MPLLGCLRGEHPTPERWRRPAMALAPCPGRDALPAVGGLHADTQLPGIAALCSVTTSEADWLAAPVAMAAGRSNARQAGSQDLAAVAGSGVRTQPPGLGLRNQRCRLVLRGRTSLHRWVPGPGHRGWVCL